jgi:hypothetical protein
LNLIKEYYRIGRERYKVEDPYNEGKINEALNALMSFTKKENDEPLKPGPY